jgi:hypothetical protein
MSGASRSQIAFARAVVRFVAYGMILNALLVIWLLWAFMFGMPQAWFDVSLWVVPLVWFAASALLAFWILVPAMLARAADQDREKGLR